LICVLYTLSFDSSEKLLISDRRASKNEQG